MKININTFLIRILYLYVFLTPFERILEILYDIDTYFKPYRIAGLLLLAFGFFFRVRKRGFFVFKPDRILYAMFGFGIIYTLIIWLLGSPVKMGGFINSTLQMVFFLLILVTIKRLDLTYKHFYGLLTIYSIGELINAGIIVSDFYIFNLSSRVQGLTDNSNYAAVQMVTVALYFLYLLQRNKFRFNLKNLLYSLGIGFMFFAILATGSRTGLVLIVGCSGLYLLLLTDLATKLRLIPFAAVIAAIVIYNSSLTTIASSASTFNRLEGVETDIRIPLWQAGTEAVLDNWFLGIGMAQIVYNKDNFRKYMMIIDPNLAKMVDSRDKALSLHSTYLEVLVEMGLIGLLIYFMYIYYLFKYQIRMLKGPRRSEHLLIIMLFGTMLLMGFTGQAMYASLYWFMHTLAGIYFKEEPDNIPLKQGAIS
jgi:O-antigen ligase